jgi:hypothetical protein
MPKQTSEETEQIHFVNWVHREHPDSFPWLHHSPNGGYRNKSTGAKMKLMGTKRGFPDLVLYEPIGPFNGLVIEMKKRGGTVHEDQVLWLEHFEQTGYKTAVCWTLEQAKTEFIGYLRAANDE